ncbi:MAG: septum site-determining protein MinC [Steroidobacteraceae bacterium]
MTTQTAEAAVAPAIDIRFGQVGLIQVLVWTTDPGAILDELTGRVATAPKFFQRTAVSLDIGPLGREPSVEEMHGVLGAVRRAGMCPVGLSSGAATAQALSQPLDLPLLPPFREFHPPAEAVGRAARHVEPVAAEPEPAGAVAQVNAHPVRSGQRLYARGRDLVVTAMVGAGAEVIADGCVHVYGALRGRAVAGARGDAAARVFCQEFHAELVSIAGVFRVFETLPPELAGKPVQAWLDGDALRFERLGA